MVVNLRAREISRGARKLARTPTLINKKKGVVAPCLHYHISPNFPVFIVCLETEYKLCFLNFRIFFV